MWVEDVNGCDGHDDGDGNGCDGDGNGCDGDDDGDGNDVGDGDDDGKKYIFTQNLP